MHKVKFTGIAIAAAIALGSCGDSSTLDTSDRDDAGEIVEGGDLGVFEVQEGDCINIPQASDEGGVSTLESVPCNVGHDAEIYELFDLAGTEEFPGGEVIETQARQGCFDAFEPYIGIGYVESQYGLTFLPPSEESWEEGDDREVICLVVQGQGQPQLTMSLEGAAS